jgi:hypothetical protein
MSLARRRSVHRLTRRCQRFHLTNVGQSASFNDVVTTRPVASTRLKSLIRFRHVGRAVRQLLHARFSHRLRAAAVIHSSRSLPTGFKSLSANDEARCSTTCWNDEAALGETAPPTGVVPIAADQRCVNPAINFRSPQSMPRAASLRRCCSCRCCCG